jgi:hypothetical protein
MGLSSLILALVPVTIRFVHSPWPWLRVHFTLYSTCAVGKFRPFETSSEDNRVKSSEFGKNTRSSGSMRGCIT